MKKIGRFLLAVFSFFLVFGLLQEHAAGAGPGDEHWDNQFGPAGANTSLTGLAAVGPNIFVGGSIVAAGNTKANGVAGFDGTNWFPLNSGLLNGPIVVGMGG